MGGAPGAKVFTPRCGTEDGLVHCKAWRSGSWCLSRGLGWDSCTHMLAATRTLCRTECTHASTLDSICCRVILTPPSFCSRPGTIPASWRALKLIHSTHGKKSRKYSIWHLQLSVENFDLIITSRRAHKYYFFAEFVETLQLLPWKSFSKGIWGYHIYKEVWEAARRLERHSCAEERPKTLLIDTLWLWKRKELS